MPFKSEAQRSWMHANHPEMADRWEKHTPKGKKLPERVKKKKSESIEDKLGLALSEAGLGPLLESRRMQPAIILMKRGTLIPVHHVREVRNPFTGTMWVIAGIDPGRWQRVYKGHFPNSWYFKLRDFYLSREYHPDSYLVQHGYQDETGWSEPDEYGHYCADRELRITRRFRKILTMNRENVKTLELLEPGTDPSKYEYKAYDDNKNWWRKSRVAGNRLEDEPIG